METNEGTPIKLSESYAKICAEEYNAREALRKIVSRRIDIHQRLLEATIGIYKGDFFEYGTTRIVEILDVSKIPPEPKRTAVRYKLKVIDRLAKSPKDWFYIILTKAPLNKFMKSKVNV